MWWGLLVLHNQKEVLMLFRYIFLPLFLFTVGPLSAEVMMVRLSARHLSFENNIPVITHFNKLQIPGMPILPAQSSIQALPSGSKIISVDVQYEPYKILENYDLAIAPPSLPLSLNRGLEQEALERWQRNRDFCESLTEPFPLQPIYYTKLSHFRNIPFVRIAYFPILYSGDKLLYYPSARIIIHFTREQTDYNIPQWAADNAVHFFSNWDDVKGYYNISAQEDSFDYVILTKDTLFGAFDSLAAWKNDIGFKTKLVSIDSVIAQYPGADIPDKIRNFLIEKYDTWSIHYLLIGGNVDLIPMKVCYPDPGHYFDTPTDYYFAELTDDWDSDGDGFYGEYDQDSIGFVPEVAVGRFPYNDSDTLRSIAIKTVNFEKDTESWKNRALLIGAFGNFENEDNTGWPSCDGAVLMEVMKDSLLDGWTYTRLYEEEGLLPSQYPHEYPLTEANVVAEWSAGSYVITNWSGHGNSEGSYRKYWLWDDGDSVPEYYEINWEPFIYITNPPLLDDAHPSIVFCASCSNAKGEENLARALMGNGASATVAATDLGWYTPGWDDPSDGNIMSLDYYFYYYLIRENQRVGDALFSAKVYYFNYLYFPDPWAGDPEWTPQQNMLGYTLFGDPSLVREGVTGIAEETHRNVVCELSFRPNPMRTRGYVRYSLTHASSVSLSLYNAIGQKMRTIYDGKRNAGIHELVFDKEDLPKGIYFLRITYEVHDGTITTQQKVVVF